MKYAARGIDSVSLIPAHEQRGIFVSKFNLGLSAGTVIRLTMLPEEHILAIAAGDPEALKVYLEQVETDCYVPRLGHIALLGRPGERPVVQHDVIFDTSYGTSSLPTLGSFELG